MWLPCWKGYVPLWPDSMQQLLTNHYSSHYCLSPAVNDTVIIVKFKYACVCELWCMEPTKCASERQGEEHQHSTWLPVIKCRPPHWPPLCTPWPQANWMCIEKEGTPPKCLAPVVQKLDSTIHRINHYPADKYYASQLRYPLDSDLSSG